MGAPSPAAIGRAGRQIGILLGCALGGALAVAPPAGAALDTAQRVADINPGPASSNPLTTTSVGRQVYFRASDGVTGTELWRSDGTEAGTHLVSDIFPGPNGSQPAEITRLGNSVVFAAFEPTGGDEPWRSDGTDAGTERLYNINPGAASSSPRSLTPFTGGVMFSASDGATGTEPWVTDGDSLGTDPLGDITPGNSNGVGAFFNPAIVGNRAFFPASSPVTGSELWRAELPGGEPELVANIALAGSSSPQQVTPSGDWIYFTADDNITGREVWRSDGEPGGTYQLVDDLDSAPTDSGVTGLTAFRNRVYFQGPDGGNGVELMRTVIPGPGATLVADINPAGDSTPQSLTPAGDVMFFTAITPGAGRELWVTDGIPAGTTTMVEDIDPGGSSICGVPYLTELNGEVFFCADDGTHGNELWRSDGTPGGTEMVTDINPAGSSNPNSLSVHGDTLYFAASDGTSGNELYAVDTAAPDTQLLDSPAAGSHIADPTPKLRLGSDAADLHRFQCSSGGSFYACAGRNGQASVKAIPDGPVTIRGRAVDARDNADPTPVAVALTIDTTGPRVRAPGRKVRLKRRAAKLKVRCGKDELTGPCGARFVVKTRKKVRVGNKRKRVTLAKGKVKLAPGAKKKTKLRFKKKARRILSSSTRARKAKLTIKASDALNNKRRTQKRVKILPR